MGNGNKKEITMVTKITRIERISDYSQSERDLLPDYSERLEEALKLDYPDAEISIRMLNECGDCELHIDCDEDEHESVREDIRHTIESCWEASI
jgi:hypothetical protein